jgi:hypothetical protein
MTKIILRLLLLILIGPSLLLARSSHKRTDQIEYNIVSLPEFIKAFSEGISYEKLQNTVLECSKGSELPIKLNLHGEMFSLMPNVLTFKILKDCYIKLGSKLLFSTDMHTWQNFSDFFTGKVATFLDFQENFVSINLELELNQQENRWEVPIGEHFGGGWHHTRSYKTDSTEYTYYLPPEPVQKATR